jgi:hypothetical protein
MANDRFAPEAANQNGIGEMMAHFVAKIGRSP